MSKKYKNPKQDITNDFFTNEEKLKMIFKELSFEWTEKQKRVVNVAQNPNTKLIILDGLPGTGKTLLSMEIMLKGLNQERYDDIKCIRSTMQAKDGRMGDLPGDKDEKMLYLAGPFYDKLNKLLEPETIMELKKKKLFEVLPTSSLRSYSWSSGILASEAQCMTFDSLVTITTRTEENSLIVIEGDSLLQNDIGSMSGFRKFKNMIAQPHFKSAGAYVFEFGVDDIMRSGLTQMIAREVLFMKEKGSEEREKERENKSIIKPVSGSYLADGENDWQPKRKTV